MIPILVTGGAGYIGSHTAKVLVKSGFEPVVYDNLSQGHRWAVKWGPFVEGDLSDIDLLKKTLADYKIQAVVHFAANCYVGESMADPRRYFGNNVINSYNLLNAMIDTGVRHIVFSSTCASYGVPDSVPITEKHPQQPISPYGESKLFVEKMLKWYANAYGFTYVALRYFNACGADPDAELGEDHDPESHLIPLVIMAVQGKISSLKVFGTDYPTPDQTAVRDYIHVADLADAHARALRSLLDGDASFACNLGTGNGYSVRQVIDSVERITGKAVPHENCPRRAGDPPVLVADASFARQKLNWIPQYTEIDKIVETAWNWHSKHDGSNRN